MKKLTLNGINTPVTEKQLKAITESLTEEQRELLLPKPHWTERLVQPMKGNYYYVASAGINCFCANSEDLGRRKPQHAFAKQDHAQLMADSCTLYIEMKNFAHVMNEGWVADWNEETQGKYGILVRNGTPSLERLHTCNFFTFGISVKSPEIVEQMLAEFGERIKEVYCKQY